MDISKIISDSIDKVVKDSIERKFKDHLTIDDVSLDSMSKQDAILMNYSNVLLSYQQLSRKPVLHWMGFFPASQSHVSFSKMSYIEIPKMQYPLNSQALPAMPSQ